MKRALITGITGQDGSYLAEQLLDRGYEVHGLVRRSSSFNTDRIDHLYRDPHEADVRLLLHNADLTESTRLIKIIYELQPDEIYHLGRSESRADQLRRARVHGRRGGDGHASATRGDQRDRRVDALLPGLERDVRFHTAASERTNTLPSTEPVRGRRSRAWISNGSGTSSSIRATFARRRSMRSAETHQTRRASSDGGRP